MSSPHLQRKLKDALGDEAGAEQAAVNDRIDPIRGDLAELKHHVDARYAALETLFERLLREQTRFFFVAWGILLAAIVALFGTVIALIR